MKGQASTVASDYEHLSRADVELRLRLAEDVCIMTGWTATDQETERGKALIELWMRWAHLVGSDYTGPKAHPELNASIASLAAQRDATREETLAHYFGPSED